jgi:hypothetical protein
MERFQAQDAMTGARITIAPGPTRQCTRCGARGTHYLTCPALLLPRGYRLSEDPASSPSAAWRRSGLAGLSTFQRMRLSRRHLLFLAQHDMGDLTETSFDYNK